MPLQDRTQEASSSVSFVGGWMHARSIMDLRSVAEASYWALERYLMEHFQAVGGRQDLPGFSLQDPFPSFDLEQILQLKAKLPETALPSLHGSVSLQSRLSSKFLSLAQGSRLLSQLKTILESDRVFLHLAPAVRVLHPTMASGLVPPHNDLSYNTWFSRQREPGKLGDTDPPIFVTVWIPLKGSVHREGGLGIYPGIQSEVKVEKGKGDFWIAPPDHLGTALREESLIEVDYSMGDAVIFAPWVWHKSLPNRTVDSFRISCDMRFFGSNTRTSKHYLDCDTGVTYEPGTGPQS